MKPLFLVAFLLGKSWVCSCSIYELYQVLYVLLLRKVFFPVTLFHSSQPFKTLCKPRYYSYCRDGHKLFIMKNIVLLWTPIKFSS